MSESNSTGSGLLTPARIAAGILVVLAVVFIVQNRDSTVITLLWVQVTSPLWFTLTVMFLVGWLTGVLMFRSRSKRTPAK